MKEDKIFIIYHYISGDGGNLIHTYKPENFDEAEVFIKSIIKDEDTELDYVIVGKDFTKSIYNELKDKEFQYIDTIFNRILTI